MDLRLRALAILPVFLVADTLCCQTARPLDAPDANWNATVQVQVRDSNGHPIAGLEPSNFLVKENGISDAVLSVQSFEKLTSTAPAPRSDIKQEQIPAQPKPAGAGGSAGGSGRPKTWVLLILAPMSATGRNASITGIQRFLKQPHPSTWSFALFDDAGQLLPFSESIEPIQSRLNTLARQFSPPQFIGGPWVPLATRAIAELGTRPGRRAVIFASDYDSDPSTRGMNRLRVGPSGFVDAAVRAEAPMYTLQAAGPGVAVPFGSAEIEASPESWNPSAGYFLAEQLNAELVGLGTDFSEFAWSAYQTGGRPARTMQDAFEKIAEDAAGIYRIAFRPQMIEANGGWHPISVEVRSSRVHTEYATYYVAPISEERLRIPGDVAAALKEGATSSGLDAASHVWIIPDIDGLSTTVMTADIDWTSTDQTLAPHSKLQIYVELVDENAGHAVGSWLTEREWNSADYYGRPTIHWQREVSLYPGSYSLQVYALDFTSRRIATKAFSFTADPFGGARAIRLSPVLLADRCIEDGEVEGRKNLFDPLMLDGCLLAPSASFSQRDKPKVLLRIYPADRKFGETILKTWRAYVTVGNSPLIPLKIAAGSVRGFIATGELDFEELDLPPGRYEVNVGLDIGAKAPVFARPSEINLKP